MDDLACEEGSTDWRPVGELLEVGAAPSPSAPPPLPKTPRPANQMTCPNCGSEDTQTFAMVHGLGTSAIDARSVSMGAFSNRTLGGALTRTQGMQSTVAASACRPPRPPSWGGFIVLLLMTIGSGCLAMFFPLFVATTMMTTAGLGLGVVLTYKSTRAEERAYPARLAAWRRQSLCMRCGATFEVKGP